MKFFVKDEEALDVCKSLTELDADTRISLEDVLCCSYFTDWY